MKCKLIAKNIQIKFGNVKLSKLYKGSKVITIYNRFRAFIFIKSKVYLDIIKVLNCQ